MLKEASRVTWVFVYHAITDLKTEFSQSFRSLASKLQEEVFEQWNFVRTEIMQGNFNDQDASRNYALENSFSRNNVLIFIKSRCTKDSLITDSRTENI